MNRTLPWALTIGFIILVLGTPALKANSFAALSLSNCGSVGTLCPAATYQFNIGVTSATLTITINGSPLAGVADRLTSVDLGFTPAHNITLAGPSFSPTTALRWLVFTTIRLRT